MLRIFRKMCNYIPQKFSENSSIFVGVGFPNWKMTIVFLLLILNAAQGSILSRHGLPARPKIVPVRDEFGPFNRKPPTCEGCTGLSSLPDLRHQTCCCGKPSVWSRPKFRRWCCKNWLYPRSLTWYDKVCTIRRGKIEVDVARTQ